jgi:hypothetical protein
MTIPVAENSPAPAGVAEPASPIYVAKTIINILRIEADPEKPMGGLQAGDCVVTLVTARTEKAYDTGQDHLIIGKVLAKVPVATNYLTQTRLNVNMFTADLAVHPGDSGSPVFALKAGKPVLIGLVSATMYPTATFTYVARIDPLLALADALRLAPSGESKPSLVRSPTATSPGQR